MIDSNIENLVFGKVLFSIGITTSVVHEPARGTLDSSRQETAKKPPRNRQEARGPLFEPDAKGIESARAESRPGLEPARLVAPLGSSPLGSCTTLITTAFIKVVLC